MKSRKIKSNLTESANSLNPKLEKHVIVRQYGLLPPLNWDQDCFEHLFLMNKFWNRLVEIEQESRRQYRAILGEIPEVAAIEEQMSKTEAEALDHYASRKEARIKHKAKTGPHTKAYDEAIKELRARHKELLRQARVIRRTARGMVKPHLDSLERDRREMVKKAYQTSGLWWANYNAVLESYNRARVRAMKEGTELKFHRFSGEGRFSCQIQGGKSTAELLDNVGTREVALRLIDQGEFAALTGRGHQGGEAREVGSRRDRRQYGILAVTVYTGRDSDGRVVRRTLDFPIILHRLLPEEGRLKMVRVNRRRIGAEFDWTATFTYTHEAEPVPPSDSPLACGINLGWKQVHDGLRVATIFDGRGPARHIVLSHALLARFARVDILKSQLDRATNEAFEWLASSLPVELPEPLQELFQSLQRAKRSHFGTFAHFVLTWKKLELPFEPELLSEADRRRRQIKRVEIEYANLREKIRRRRLDFYRNEAKSLAEKYGTIVLDRMDLQRLAALEAPDGTPTELPETARKRRGWAAVSELRDWIKKQSAKSGTIILEKGIASTVTCHVCGEKGSKSVGTVTLTCSNCGSSWDSDSNAAANLLRTLHGVAHRAGPIF